MLLVEDYLKLPQADRQTHLKLDEPCNERGGSSTQHRGVLSEYLNTPIYGKPADLCHACHNAECSNPRHLYWGTRKENIQDSKDNGTFKNGWQNLVEKYGYEEACNMRRKGNKSAGGKANKGKPKSEEHKKKIATSIKKMYDNKHK